jgi:hypothetical protein
LILRKAVNRRCTPINADEFEPWHAGHSQYFGERHICASALIGEGLSAFIGGFKL